MSTLHRVLVVVAVLAVVGIAFVTVRRLRDRGEDGLSHEPGTVGGVVSTEASSAQQTGDARGYVGNSGGKANDSNVTVANGAPVRDGPIQSAPVMLPSQSATPEKEDQSDVEEEARRFTVCDQATYTQQFAELSAVGDRAKGGDLKSIRTLMAVADSMTGLSGEAVRMLGRVPAKSPELVEHLVRYSQTPDFRVSTMALEALPKITDESRALAVVSNVLAKCWDAEYGSTNKVGPVCVFVGRDKIREACVGVLASFRSVASLAIVEQELNAVERAATTDVRQLEYGSRLVALLRDMGEPAGAAILGRYAERLVANRPKDPVSGSYFDQKVAEARQANDGR